MFFRDVADETFYEIHNRQSFFHILIVFVTVVMESDGISVIPVNPGGGYNRSAKIAADIFCNCFGVAQIRFGIDIKSMFVLSVTFRFYFFERRADPVFQFIKKSSTESAAEIVVVKVFYMTPESVITVTAFGKDAVDVGIPFQVSAKSMEDHDVAGSVIFGMVQVKKHP